MNSHLSGPQDVLSASQGQRDPGRVRYRKEEAEERLVTRASQSFRRLHVREYALQSRTDVALDVVDGSSPPNRLRLNTEQVAVG